VAANRYRERHANIQTNYQHNKNRAAEGSKIEKIDDLLEGANGENNSSGCINNVSNTSQQAGEEQSSLSA
jgi:hypothetical protein